MSNDDDGFRDFGVTIGTCQVADEASGSQLRK